MGSLCLVQLTCSATVCGGELVLERVGSSLLHACSLDSGSV